MPETTTELSLTLSERHTADFEMIANGGFAPLGGFMGSEDWRRVTDEMRLASDRYWSIPITLATDLDCAEGDVVELSADNGKKLGRIRSRRSSIAIPSARPSRSTAPPTPSTRGRGDLRGGPSAASPGDRGRRAPRSRGGLPAPLSDSETVAGGSSRSGDGSGSSPFRPANRSTAPTST